MKKQPRITNLDGVFDNRGTYRREYYIQGRLVNRIDASMIDFMRKRKRIGAENPKPFEYYPPIPQIYC